MKIVVQKEFSAPSPLSTVNDEPLVIHQRTKPSANRHLVIFVHGLGGSRYATSSTWGSFPQFIFEDFPRVDVGLYSFRSALSRWKFWRSVPVPREAEVLASTLRTLQKDGPYDWFVLIGHSLGGLLCKGAMVSLVERGHKSTLERISSLVLMATPQLGSLRVPGFVQWATHDSRVLRAHSEFVESLTQSFQSHFHCGENASLDDRVHVPT